jgi:hypothetical protein
VSKKLALLVFHWSVIFMPSKKSFDQCMLWLNSKAADRDSLDGINAELCINVINDLKAQKDKLGATIGMMKRKSTLPELDYDICCHSR